ncbi:MAG: thiamine pyrophosphate-dependent dehydrogenase E1 component subunit alpha [Actinomycetia bacterium]|nr:thiamine pyrophosphate-dependent dehydrogenase E1 component subunit alpha [Actinomycetes bacterium]
MEIKRKEHKQLYLKMQKIRKFENESARLFEKGKIHGAIHLYLGEESIAAGICSNLRKDDYITSTHRGHGHCIAKGASLKIMMAELMGKETGYCKGKGGSMHIADFSLGIIGANGIVGAGLPIAVGSSMYSKLINKDDRVTVCFFGDGASNEGAFHESLNFAALKGLPILFVCENNKYAVSTHFSNSVPTKNIVDRAKAYDIEGILIDGFDVINIYETANKLIKKIRKGNGPILLECDTYRWEGHYLGDPQLYKEKKELEYYIREKDPIKLYRDFLIKNKIFNSKELSEVDAEVDKELKKAVEFAEDSPFPDENAIFDDIYI